MNFKTLLPAIDRSGIEPTGSKKVQQPGEKHSLSGRNNAKVSQYLNWFFMDFWPINSSVTWDGCLTSEGV